jgi:hypothetical protein
MRMTLTPTPSLGHHRRRVFVQREAVGSESARRAALDRRHGAVHYSEEAGGCRGQGQTGGGTAGEMAGTSADGLSRHHLGGTR